MEVGKQSRLGHRQEAKWKSTDSVYLPGFWGRQTRKIWARQREDGVMCQKWGGFLLSSSQSILPRGLPKGPLRCPPCSGTDSTQKQGLSSICSEDPWSHQPAELTSPD